jgi:hypothetical protein
MEDLRLQKIAYSVQKSHAKFRGVEFKLTFDEWWDIWKPHYHNRGSKVGQFVMCRTMDKGAYEVGNVRINTVKGNAHTRKLVSFDKRMKELQSAHVGSYKESIEDDEDGWLPKELKGQLRSAFP